MLCGGRFIAGVARPHPTLHFPDDGGAEKRANLNPNRIPTFLASLLQLSFILRSTISGQKKQRHMAFVLGTYTAQRQGSYTDLKPGGAIAAGPSTGT